MKWSLVCSPLELGGLGIHDLYRQSKALKVRWLWQNASCPDKPWHGLPLPIDKEIKNLFYASTSWEIGSGTGISFWHDHWLDGISPSLAYPKLFKHSKRRNITLSQGINNRFWVTLIKPNPCFEVIAEYLDFWHRADQVVLSQADDKIIWKWTSNKIYSANSAYHCQFIGRIYTPLSQLILEDQDTTKGEVLCVARHSR